MGKGFVVVALAVLGAVGLSLAGNETSNIGERIREARKRAFMSIAEGDFKSGIKTLEELKHEFPTSDRVLTDLALAKHLAGESEEACAVLEKRVEAGDCEGYILRVYASAALKSGNFGAVLKAAERVLAKEPNDSSARAVHTAALFELGAEKKALKVFEDAVLKGDDANILRYAVVYFLKAGRINSALSAVEQYIAITGSADGYLLRASVYREMGELDRAIEDYKEAVRICPCIKKTADDMIKDIKKN